MGSPVDTITYLLPEILVAATGALVIIADLVWRRPDSAPRTIRPWLAYIGLAGLAAAAVASLSLAGANTNLFEGLVLVDPLTAFFRLLFIVIAAFILLISVDPLPRFSRWDAEYHALVLWCTSGHMLLASAGELFTIFLALQLTSLPLIVLIGIAKRDRRSGEASLKYLLMVLVSTAVLLYGMTLIYGSLGTSTISEIGALLGDLGEIPPVLALGLVLLLTGFAFKITAVPFHWWVPDVYEGAPTPVTAFLSVGSKFAGFALALRIVITGLHLPMKWHLIFGVMAALSMTLGNLAAIKQSGIKRMLAYSGIAQAGFLLVGLAASTAAGVGSLLFYMVAYGLANIAAFTVVIVVSASTGDDRITSLSGLSRTSPLPAFVLAVSLLSLAGLPLMAGFIAKFHIFLQAAQAGLVWLVAIGVINSVISLYYYLRVLWHVYVAEEPSGTSTAPVHVPWRIGLVMVLCTVGVLVLGVLPAAVIDAANVAAATLFGG